MILSGDAPRRLLFVDRIVERLRPWRQARGRCWPQGRRSLLHFDGRLERAVARFRDKFAARVPRLLRHWEAQMGDVRLLTSSRRASKPLLNHIAKDAPSNFTVGAAEMDDEESSPNYS
jgi:hypothetical protein